MTTPISAPNDPNLDQVVHSIEKQLIDKIVEHTKSQQLDPETAKQLAQDFLALLPVKDKQELLEKLHALGKTYQEVREVSIDYIVSEEEKKRQQTLDTMRDHIKQGNIDQAIAVAKEAYK